MNIFRVYSFRCVFVLFIELFVRILFKIHGYVYNCYVEVPVLYIS